MNTIKNITLAVFMLFALLQFVVNAQVDSNFNRGCRPNDQVCDRFNRNAFFQCRRGRFVRFRCPRDQVCINVNVNGRRRVRCVRRRL
ncbi:hypothetical protein BB559_002530 [Furculomyces boomerangus]|uniref:Chitin-binding type-2 domain-containing protein n=1 Tax=Furculomyces boomerangus TaxID=61424 RepID=A0A2T9YUJ0_9FUNG|nr:hypothetical protein BB559_002530 [Furculomyces boomerangus]